jgi:hypothetical protein
MDDLTANSDVVLASLGGKPTMRWEKRGSEDEEDSDRTATASPQPEREKTEASAVADNREDGDIMPDGDVGALGERMETRTRTGSSSETDYLERRQGIKRQGTGSYSR